MKIKTILIISLVAIPIIILLNRCFFIDDVLPCESYETCQAWQNKEILLELALHNKETIPFVSAYPMKHNQKFSLDLTQDLQIEGIPLLLQWDERWGYLNYGDDMMAINGCGPTCLSMILSYLTKDVSLNPYALAQYAYTHGYYRDDGTANEFMFEVPSKYGIEVQELRVDEQIVINELQAGHPIICNMGPGLFTTTSHFIVFKEYKDGLIYINDPDSRIKSEKGYTFEEIQSQIKCLWSYDKK